MLNIDVSYIHYSDNQGMYTGSWGGPEAQQSRLDGSLFLGLSYKRLLIWRRMKIWLPTSNHSGPAREHISCPRSVVKISNK